MISSWGVKLSGYVAGVLCLIVKFFLILLIFYYHIKEGYKENKTVELECIAVSAALGISALYNTLLFILKGKSAFKKIMRPLWSKQYFLSACSSICFIEFISLRDTPFFWTVSVLPVAMVTLEFLFYLTFVDLKENESLLLPLSKEVCDISST